MRYTPASHPVGSRVLALPGALSRHGHRALTVDVPSAAADTSIGYAERLAAQLLADLHWPVIVAHSAAGLLLPAGRAARPCPPGVVGSRTVATMVLRSMLLFVVAAVAEIGGAWLVWQGVREHRGWVWVGAGVTGLGLYGFVATLQPDVHFGRILAAYGGVFVAGSLAWGMALDGFRPDRWDVIGALVCLAGVAVIMYAPRGH